MNKKHDSVKYFMSLSQEMLIWEFTPKKKKQKKTISNPRKCM